LQLVRAGGFIACTARKPYILPACHTTWINCGSPMKFWYFLLSLLCLSSSSPARDVTVASPNTRLQVTLSVAREVSLSASDGRTPLITVAPLRLDLRGTSPFTGTPQIEQVARRSCDTTLVPVVREKEAAVRDLYNEVTVSFRGEYAVTLRVYNEGFAYRLATMLDHEIVVDAEPLSLRFPAGTSTIAQYNDGFWSAYEAPYHVHTAETIPSDSVINLPMLAQLKSGHRIVFTEAQIKSYPGLWLRHAGQGRLAATFPAYPTARLEGTDLYRRGMVTARAAEIARTTGMRSFPWRVFCIARTDAALLANAMVYLLGEPSRVQDPSWVKPGMVTLDWWGRRNMFGVDFVGGVNTPTVKYFIDFAAKYGIRYVLLDEGWSPDDDLLRVSAGLDMPEVLTYARSKNVEILLWAIWSTLERQWDAAFGQFSRWGIAGIKIDFMNSDDQQMVEYYHKCAEETARRKMLVLFHGAYKPDGMQRTWPNAPVREGLIEFEQNGVNQTDTPWYHTVLPFIRMVTGAADYLPGTVRNATPQEFRMIPDRPMGQGTRAHTTALCVILPCPLRMLPDSPSDYLQEDAYTRFMTSIPVEWDEERVLEAKIGEVVAVARRRGKEWFIGAVTNGEERDLHLDLSFLDSSAPYVLTSLADGKNANTRASDHVINSAAVHAGDTLTVHLAKGGGFVARMRQF
jgi:alpha-glucosidase